MSYDHFLTLNAGGFWKQHVQYPERCWPVQGWTRTGYRNLRGGIQVANGENLRNVTTVQGRLKGLASLRAGLAACEGWRKNIAVSIQQSDAIRQGMDPRKQLTMDEILVRGCQWWLLRCDCEEGRNSKDTQIGTTPVRTDASLWRISHWNPFNAMETLFTTIDLSGSPLEAIVLYCSVKACENSSKTSSDKCSQIHALELAIFAGCVQTKLKGRYVCLVPH